MINNSIKVASFQRVHASSADQEGRLVITQAVFPFDDQDIIARANAKDDAVREFDRQVGRGLSPRVSSWRPVSGASLIGRAA